MIILYPSRDSMGKLFNKFDKLIMILETYSLLK